MIVRVLIERLVVEGSGLRPSDHHVLGRALTMELSRLVTEGEIDAAAFTSRVDDRVAAPPLAARAWSSPAALGAGAARSLFEGIQR